MPLGVHFAITPEQAATLEAFDDDEDRVNHVKEVIEEEWDEAHLVQTDKAWDGIHRCLSDFPPDTPWFYPVEPRHGAWALPEDHGDEPLKRAVLGGRKLMKDEHRYFIRLVTPEEVAAIAKAMKPIDRDWMHAKYMAHCRGAWPEYGEEDFEYTWEYFEILRDFYARMAGNGRFVIFTADQ